MEHVVVRWQAHEYEHVEKERQWYWAVGIVAAGVAIAAIILQNYLFAVICVIGGFTVMLVGSARPQRLTYSITENGFRVGKDLIPFEKITRFAISEDEPRHLTIESKTLIGVVKAPLEGVDFRAIRMELKNHDIQEEDKLDTVVDRVAKTMGL
ncbi:hypothetical protein K2X83_00750 [Patescibacteria group bacterium]|nr:hypothetical protein [Patescibacteria group bacterium]